MSVILDYAINCEKIDMNSFCNSFCYNKVDSNQRSDSNRKDLRKSRGCDDLSHLVNPLYNQPDVIDEKLCARTWKNKAA